MPTFDYVAGVLARMWDLLEAHAPVADGIKPGNRIRFDGPLNNPVKNNKLGDCFPELMIEPGDFTDSLFRTDPVFGLNADGFMGGDVEWTEDLAQTFTLTLTHRDMRYGRADVRLDLEVLTALRKGGPRLGLDYVVAWGPARGTRGRTKQNAAPGSPGTTGNTLRAVTRIVVPVVMQFPSARSTLL